jgi:hypothetical protein
MKPGMEHQDCSATDSWRGRARLTGLSESRVGKLDAREGLCLPWGAAGSFRSRERWCENQQWEAVGEALLCLLPSLAQFRGNMKRGLVSVLGAPYLRRGWAQGPFKAWVRVSAEGVTWWGSVGNTEGPGTERGGGMGRKWKGNAPFWDMVRKSFQLRQRK